MSIKTFSLTFVLLLLTINVATAQESTKSTALQDLVNRSAKTTLERFADKKLDEKQLSITLIDLRDAMHPVTASFRGNERIYPASVVKLFYLAAAQRWLEDKKIEETPELTRAIRDMTPWLSAITNSPFLSNSRTLLRSIRSPSTKKFSAPLNATLISVVIFFASPLLASRV